MPNFGPVIGEGGQANNDQNSQDGKPPYVNSTPGISVLPFSNIDFGAYGRPNEHISTVPLSIGLTDSNTSDDSNDISTPFGEFDLSGGKIVTPWGNVDAPAVTKYVGEAADKLKDYVGDKSSTTKTISDIADLVKSHVSEPSKPPPTSTTDSKDKPATSTTSAPAPQTPGTNADDKSNIKALQEMFRDSQAVKALLGRNFVGKIDGGVGGQTNSFAREIEDKIATILGTNKVFNQVLSTTPDDVIEAINLTLAYQNSSKKSGSMFSFEEKKTNRSDRIYALSKILIKSHKV